VAIDEAAPPDWLRKHVSPGQLRLQRGLLWIVAMYESPTLGKAEINVAQRLHIATEGQDKKERQLSHAELAHSTKQSQQTNITAIKNLEAEGWVMVTRVNNKVNRYRLAWPVDDVLATVKQTHPLCGEPTKKDSTCTRPAGWGTKHQGVGRCKVHEPEEETSPELQPLESETGEDGPLQLQPLESDTPRTEQASTPIDASFNSNPCVLQLQKMEPPTPTIGALYVGTSGTQIQVRGKSQLLAVGEPTRRNAREAQAPPAQTKDHTFLARSVLKAIPRYKNARGWVRTRHLVPMAEAALNAGFGRDAIVRYARMVIDEQRYPENQHIREFRDALNRLNRDAALGDACRPHGKPECLCAADDRPWTQQDQADLEAALAHLGVTPDDLNTGTD